MNPSGKVQLVFVNVLGNLHVPLMSRNLDDILAGCKQDILYILVTFFFTWKHEKNSFLDF